MPDFEYTDISISDFDTALQAYLARLEREEKANTPTWKKVVKTLVKSETTFGGRPVSELTGFSLENIGEKYDRIYGEIMDAVDLYGLSPEIARILPQDSAQLFSTTLQRRASYEWEKTYQGNVEKWAEDVVKLQAKSYDQQLSTARFGLQQQQFQFAQQQAGISQAQSAARLKEEQRQFDFRAKREAQKEIWAGERARQGLLGEQMNLATQRLAMRDRQDPRVLEAEKARIFESARAEILSGLTGAGDWIKRWEARNKVNKWQQSTQQQEQDDIARVREQIKGLKEASAIIQKRTKDPTDPLFVNVDRLDMPTTPEQTYAAGIASRLRTAENKLLEFTAPTKREIEAAEITGTDPTKIGALGVQFLSNPEQFANLSREERSALTSAGLQAGFSDAPPEERPTGPPTPAFISKLFPSQAGNLVKANIGRVSGQAFGRLTPSQQAGLAGFAEFQGMEPGEILPQFSQRRPGPRWSPQKQRISV